MIVLQKISSTSSHDAISSEHDPLNDHEGRRA